MTSGKLLRKLFLGYSKHDDAAFRRVAQEIIQSERAKNHRLLADDLEKIILNGNGTSREKRLATNTYNIPVDRESQLPLLQITKHDYDWSRLVLPSDTVDKLHQITEEYYKKDILASGGMKPRQNILFFGPPGCGKTLTAKVLSGTLFYPLVTVRFDAIVSSLLGETATNLRKVFDFIQRGQWIVLFDEFDAIGKDRDNQFEHGELKRVVNSLLQLIDAYHGESLLIAATNHENLLDNAIWRRFEMVLSFNRPKLQDRILLLRQFLKGFDGSKLDLTSIGRILDGATGFDIELLCMDAARKALLDNRNFLTKKDMEVALNTYKERKRIFEENSLNS